MKIIISTIFDLHTALSSVKSFSVFYPLFICYHFNSENFLCLHSFCQYFPPSSINCIESSPETEDFLFSLLFGFLSVISISFLCLYLVFLNTMFLLLRKKALTLSTARTSYLLVNLYNILVITL